jgi:nucleoside-diphosphate-sugar epimerase
MILVTGGAGFIGSHIVAALLKRGQNVRILDNLTTGKKENLEEATGCSLANYFESGGRSKITPLGKRGEFLFGDITDFAVCRQACQGISHVFHEAALTSVQRSVEDPVSSHQINTTGTLNILLGAKEAGVKRLVYASSSSVYGDVSSDPEEVKPKEESLASNPQSPYAAAKLSGENYCHIFSQVYGLETVSLRYFNVFGPRQNPQSDYAAVIPKFMAALLGGRSPTIYGDGNQSRDFTYVDDVVQANLLAMEKREVSGGFFNIACSRRTSVNELLHLIQRISGQNIPPVYEQARKGEVRHSIADTRLAKTKLGYKVNKSLEEGLSLTWKWFQEKRMTG